MVSTRGSRRRSEEKHQEKTNGVVGDRKRGRGSSSKSSSGAGVAADYEEKRAQRMQENMERMKKLGILDLSKKLKQERFPHKKRVSATVSTFPASNDPPRRSSRLKTKDPVSYSEIRTRKEEKVKNDADIYIKEGSKPEVYTEEHEKLLGDSKTTWTLFVDGYDGEGERIYDQYLGKSCHQCRQKTLGHRTSCSKCKLKSGQFCGDCLYTRYGENVLEVNENPNWICPVCRGICNCNCCRRKKGWAPIGLIYKNVKRLGFKSVAHYLIQTFRPGSKFEEPASISTDSANASLSNADERNDSSFAIPVPVHHDDRELDSEDEYIAEAISSDGEHDGE